MFLGEPLGFFISTCFHFFSFLFLLAFISSCHHFFRCFNFWLHLFTSLFLYCWCCYRQCYGFERAFFTFRVFLPYTLFQNLAQSVFIKASLRVAVQLWRLQGFPLRFEKQTLLIYLFESHSVRQKVLLGMFYLCVRDCYKLLY